MFARFLLISAFTEENVMGGIGKGVYVLMTGLDYERLILSGGPLGYGRSNFYYFPLCRQLMTLLHPCLQNNASSMWYCLRIRASSWGVRHTNRNVPSERYRNRYIDFPHHQVYFLLFSANPRKNGWYVYYLECLQIIFVHGGKSCWRRTCLQ